MRVHAVVVTSM